MNREMRSVRKALRGTVAEKAETLRVKVRELEATLGYLKEAWSTPLNRLCRAHAARVQER
jgi:hypothetical protein